MQRAFAMLSGIDVVNELFHSYYSVTLIKPDPEAVGPEGGRGPRSGPET